MHRKGMAVKSDLLHSKGVLTQGFWDGTVFSRYQQWLGGSLRLIFTGNEHMASGVLDNARIVFACPVVSLYVLLLLVSRARTVSRCG